MRLIRQYTTLLFIVLALSACAQLGLKAPETFNQKVAVAYGTTTQIRESATQLILVKKITPADAMNIQSSADMARLGIDTARQMHAANPDAADQRLNAVITGLNALATYLAAREAAKP
jgi:hypothetical protein